MVGAQVCELTDGFLWFVCGLYVGIFTSPLMLEMQQYFPGRVASDRSIESNRMSMVYSLSDNFIIKKNPYTSWKR